MRVDVVIQHSAPNPQARGMKSAGTAVTMTRKMMVSVPSVKPPRWKKLYFPRLSVEMPRFCATIA